MPNSQQEPWLFGVFPFVLPLAFCYPAGFIDLGVLKGKIGDQNYTLGSDLDLGKHRAVSIWCKRFSVNFGAAALKPITG